MCVCVGGGVVVIGGVSITSAIFNLNMGAIVCTKFCQSLSTDGPLNRGHVAKSEGMSTT